MKLFEINERLMKLLEQNIDQETGEITGIDEEAFIYEVNALNQEKADRFDTLCAIYDECKAMGEAIKEKKLILAKRQQAFENRVESLKRVIAYYYEDKFETAEHKVSYRKSEKAICNIEPTDLPTEYQKVKVEADLTAIKAALKEGNNIEGCYIATNNNIQIK